MYARHVGRDLTIRPYMLISVGGLDESRLSEIEILGYWEAAMSSNHDSTVKKARVLVVDDHPVVREGLTWLMEHAPDIEVCGGAGGVAEALDQIQRLEPELVVVDLSLKDGSGLHLIRQVRVLHPRIKMLVWSMFDEKIYTERSIRAGAMGYVNKQESMETVLAAVREVIQGRVFAGFKTRSNSLLGRADNNRRDRQEIDALSDRESEIFLRIGRGKTTQEIASELGIKRSTVETHREKIKAKLSLFNATQLNARAIQWVIENGEKDGRREPEHDFLECVPAFS